MAKKKRKHRNPVAPPVHSAPGSASATSRPATPGPGPATAPSSTPAPAASRQETKPRRQPAASRQAAKRRKARRRNWLIIGSIVVLLLAALIVPRILGGRAVAELNRLGEAAGCSEVEETGDSGDGDHLQEGESTEYDSVPPSHGAHSPSTLPGGVYDEPLSDNPGEELTIFRAVHSLEHGAIILWHDGLEDEDVEELSREYRDADKVIVAPFPGLRGDEHFAMTAWGRLMKCEEMSTRVADRFIDIFRSARTAPEPNNAI